MNPEQISRQVALRLDDHGRLLLVDGEECTPVRVQLCFPWTEPARYFSLRDAEDKEVFFVEDPSRLDVPSREALLEAVQRTRFVFEVEKVIEVKLEHELRLWQVETDQGARRFQTKLDDWPRRIHGDNWLIRDVGGDLYLFWQLSEMDEKSRLILSAYLDLDPT